MATFDFKTATPDSSFAGTELIMGADSQAAATPSIYTFAGILTYLRSVSQLGIVAASGAAVADPGNTTAETTMATITIPANSMGVNGSLRIMTTWSTTNNANAKTVRFRLGGASGTQFATVNIASALSADVSRMIQNRNSASSQVGNISATSVGAFGVTSGNAVVTATVDTTAAVDLIISIQKGTGTDSTVLERYTVEVLRA
jgi:hypothetical protein